MSFPEFIPPFSDGGLYDLHPRPQEQLELFARLQTAALTLGRVSQMASSLDEIFEHAVNLLADTLDVEYTKILQYLPEQNRFLLMAGVGWQPGLTRATFIDGGTQSQAGYTLQNGLPVVVEDLHTETRFHGPAFLREHGVVSGVSVIIPGTSSPYGVLGIHTRASRSFCAAEVQLVEAVAGILASAVDRKRTDLARQRYAARLAVQHDIDQALLGSQTFEQVARSVVSHLRRLLSCARASVATFDFRSHTFTVVASETNRMVMSAAVTRPFESYPVDIFRLEGGNMIQVEDTAAVENPTRTMLELIDEGVRSITALPMIVQGKLIGSMNIGFAEYGPAEADDLEVADELAGALALAFQKAALVAAERRRINRLDALHEIDLAIINQEELGTALQVVIERVISCLKVDAALILLFDQNQYTFGYGAGGGFRTENIRSLQLHLGQGIAGRVALEQRTYFARNLQEAGSLFADQPALAGEDFEAYYAVPLMAKTELKGVMEVFHRGALDPDQEWLDFLQALATQAAIAIENAGLFAGMQWANRSLAQAYDATIEGWSRALDLRDRETEGHTMRVADLAVRFSRFLGLDERELVQIRRGSLLHDIGKMGVPDAVLLKPGPLTEAEWEMMRRHPDLARELLSQIEYLQPALDIPYCHHERWDGSGYPRGLKEGLIPLAARIFAVIDVWDALRSDRPYRQAWPPAESLEYILKHSGTQFDPRVARAFAAFINREELPRLAGTF